MNLIPSILLIGFFAFSLDPVNAQEPTGKRNNQFRHFSYNGFGQVGAGYVVVEKGGEGLATISLEMTLQARYYFAVYDDLLKMSRPRDISLYFRLGGGPLLVREGVVPIYVGGNLGFTYNYKSTNFSYGVIAAKNLKEGQEPEWLYGLSASLEKVQIPFFVHLLRGERMHYLFVGGFRVPVSNFLPLNWEIRPRKTR